MPTRTFLCILMSRNQTSFLTFLSTLSARRVVLSHFSLVPFYSLLMFLQSLVNAISRIRFENGKSPSVVRQFLIDQLRYNDNTANPVGSIFSSNADQPHRVCSTRMVSTSARLFQQQQQLLCLLRPPREENCSHQKFGASTMLRMQI
jgi:hypothetical protein